ncbi:Autoinducer synthetase [Pelagimonas phthalicica]|uniref:Acyl-homoserine-lactone synthase n=1 Tax=Pelagimonas phthalicica TaxID=1037362 RepID=A0A238JA52_9RHOB|nr:acyl-homoserine-lactone synthase [Pelagimonas phthalicica]TDS94210.1 acyl homoserine lactone synthase/acyl homoserine lactone synthase [Pelagimonas phthalicica]SMX27265.1 Autoinducer synthetase [Pelagimonas phthalicica]
METAIITWKTIHEHGDLWWQHHCLRKALFVDEMKWQIPHTDQVEWDQYDTGATTYVVSHQNGRALAASRLIPCSFNSCDWSYMIRDASLGKLPGIPTEICDSPPTDSDTLEATRFTVDPLLAPEERNAVLTHNALALASHARATGVQRLIALMPPAYIRWLTGIGLPSRRYGPTLRTPEGNRICAIEMPISYATIAKQSA